MKGGGGGGDERQRKREREKKVSERREKRGAVVKKLRTGERHKNRAVSQQDRNHGEQRRVRRGW